MEEANLLGEDISDMLRLKAWPSNRDWRKGKVGKRSTNMETDGSLDIYHPIPSEGLRNLYKRATKRQGLKVFGLCRVRQMLRMQRKV